MCRPGGGAAAAVAAVAAVAAAAASVQVIVFEPMYDSYAGMAQQVCGNTLQ
jgi:aspartate/methionine/tyrosine aminotransferase